MGNGSEMVSCSVLTTIDPGVLTCARLFSTIVLWPSDNSVRCMSLLCVFYFRLFPLTFTVFLLEAIQECTKPLCLIAKA
jgi:hypothetical protein